MVLIFETYLLNNGYCGMSPDTAQFLAHCKDLEINCMTSVQIKTIEIQFLSYVQQSKREQAIPLPPPDASERHATIAHSTIVGLLLIMIMSMG
jgi:hypothetical protein